MTREFIDFVRIHQNEDTARLLLSAARYPSIDMPMAVQQIEGLRTAREKWPSLAAADGYLFPPRLNREQASSETTARYKASLIGHVGRAADLTGGMGIDTLAIAGVADVVDYVEQNEPLCRLEETNFRLLQRHNITCHSVDCMQWLANQPRFDLIFIDPARRSTAGRRVAAFDDCTPNLLSCGPLLRTHCTHMLVKASPMIDIDLAVQQIGWVEEVHILSVDGECKEVLFLCHEGASEPMIHACAIRSGTTHKTCFRRSEELSATPSMCRQVRHYIYEPDAALLKAGCFRLLSQRWNVEKLSSNTHLYTSDTLYTSLAARVYEVIDEIALNRKSIRKAIPTGRASVMSRNYPVTAAALQRQLGLGDGGDLCVVATTVGSQPIGLLCRRVQSSF